MMHNAYLYNFKFYREADGKKELAAFQRVKINHSEERERFFVFDEDEGPNNAITYSIIVSIEEDKTLDIAGMFQELIDASREGALDGA